MVSACCMLCGMRSQTTTRGTKRYMPMREKRCRELRYLFPYALLVEAVVEAAAATKSTLWCRVGVRRPCWRLNRDTMPVFSEFTPSFVHPAVVARRRRSWVASARALRLCCIVFCALHEISDENGIWKSVYNVGYMLYDMVLLPHYTGWPRV